METPEFFQTRYYNPQLTPEKRYSDNKSGAGDHFAVEDLLEFPNDNAMGDGNVDGTVAGISTVVESCNSSFSSGGKPHFPGDMGCRSFVGDQFSGDLCVPYDDLAELEWLSNFVEESFSTEDLQKLQLISGMSSRADEGSETHGSDPDLARSNLAFRPEVSVPGKARSKRSRAAPGNWASRLLALSSTQPMGPPPPAEHDDVAFAPGKKPVKAAPKRRESGDNSGSDGRKCLHCATDKTPQWRTGPMGPKTLCNACGVRYKSGRLVPEYRPAASPTFVLTKHSNSHRKVMELRRQKEVHKGQHQHQHQHFFHHLDMAFEESNGDDYLIHQQIGPDFGQLI